MKILLFHLRASLKHVQTDIENELPEKQLAECIYNLSLIIPAGTNLKFQFYLFQRFKLRKSYSDHCNSCALALRLSMYLASDMKVMFNNCTYLSLYKNSYSLTASSKYI